MQNGGASRPRGDIKGGISSDEEFKGYQEIEIKNKRKSTESDEIGKETVNDIKMSNKKRIMDIDQQENTEKINNPQHQNKKKMELNKYIATDKGPYYVMVGTETPRKMMSILLARIFKENKIKTKNIIEVNNRMARIEFDTYDKANKCVREDDPIRKILTGKGYGCFIPKTYTHVEGIVRGIVEEFSMEEIQGNLTSEYPITNMEVIKTWDRINKTLKNTNILKVEIRANMLPRWVYFYEVKLNTNIYIPKIKFCAKCLGYGHTAKFCHSKIRRCTGCAQPVPEGEKHDCKEKPKCRYCEGEQHFTNSRECTEKKKQIKIKIYMIKNKTTLKETMNTLYPRNRDISNEAHEKNFPRLTQNEEQIPNTWVAKIKRQEEIVKEQRTKIEKLQETLNRFIQITNRNYDMAELLTIDLREVVKTINN